MYFPLAKKDQPPTLENLVAARVMQIPGQPFRIAAAPTRALWGLVLLAMGYGQERGIAQR